MIFNYKRVSTIVQSTERQLIDLIPEETDFFFTIQRKAVKNLGNDKLLAKLIKIRL